MSTINNLSGAVSGNTIQTNGKVYHLMDRYQTVALGESPNLSGWTVDEPFPRPHSQQIHGMKEMFFSDAKLYASQSMGPEVREIHQQIDSAAGQFVRGDISAEELAHAFQGLAERFIGSCKSSGYPNSLLADSVDEIALSAFYDTFRQKLLKAAVDQNNREGRQYVTGEMNSQRNWMYYNSDYYFKCEDGISAISEKALGMAQEKGLDQFELPDYQALGKTSLLNFNTALSGIADTIPGGLTMVQQSWILDCRQVPPKGFQWFYQSGGNGGEEGVLLSVSDGVNTYEMDYSRFDPENPLCATAWVSYTDPSGEKHQISTDFTFDHSAADLQVLSSLLQFSGKKGWTAAVNKFMGNFQVFPKGYLQRSLAEKRLNARA